MRSRVIAIDIRTVLGIPVYTIISKIYDIRARRVQGERNELFNSLHLVFQNLILSEASYIMVKDRK